MIENLLSKFSYDMWVALAILAGLLAWAFAKGRKDPRSKNAPTSREQRGTTQRPSGESPHEETDSSPKKKPRAIQEGSADEFTSAKQDIVASREPSDPFRPRIKGPHSDLSSSVEAQLLAPGMVYALAYGDYLNSFGLSDSRGITKMLKRDWDITDRSTLLRQIYSMLRDGHRSYYNDLRKKALDLAASQTRVNPGFPKSRWRELSRFISNERGLQTTNFTAWDLMRAANLTRAGEGLGWMTRDEAEDTLALINHGLRTTYSSWEEACDAFIVTRWLWLNEEGEAMEASDLHDQRRREALVGPNGVWNKIPWDGTYPSPRYLLLDASDENFQLNPMSRFEWEDAPRWERELDDESHKRIQERKER